MQSPMSYCSSRHLDGSGEWTGFWKGTSDSQSHGQMQVGSVSDDTWNRQWTAVTLVVFGDKQLLHEVGAVPLATHREAACQELSPCDFQALTLRRDSKLIPRLKARQRACAPLLVRRSCILSQSVRNISQQVEDAW
jgi:hypothetical protein